MALGSRAPREHLPPAAAGSAVAARHPRSGWPVDAESVVGGGAIRRELADGGRARARGTCLDDLSGRAIRKRGIHSLRGPIVSMVRRGAGSGGPAANGG